MTGSHPTRSRFAAALRPAAFGADPAGERMERIRRSPNFANGVFVNPVGARTGPSGSMLKFASTYFRKEERIRRAPAGAVPVHPTTVADLAAPPASGLRLTWMGHSSVLAEIDGRRVLFDPVWGQRCSPFSMVGPKRLHPVPVPLRELAPVVDVVVISHDHYDHLDMPTIRALVRGHAMFVVPLGVGAHLERWGVPADRMTELDWHESTEVAGLTLTATPARHFCGRGLRNTQHTLWASWVVAGPEHRVYHSGLELVSLCGGVPVLMDTDAHDRAVALTSHAPHLVASMMAARLEHAEAEHIRVSGQGLRDVTRIAAGEPALWSDILTANADAVADVLDGFAKDLERLIAVLRALPGTESEARRQAAADLQELLRRGNRGHARVPHKQRSQPAEYVAIPVAVPDQPGALARLFSTVGEAGVNIEDVRIEHSLDQPSGLVELLVESTSVAGVRRVLDANGWTMREKPLLVGDA
ncbi:MBL fold metallo-hydrolase [Streptomyces sp. NPDC020125]|uniref:MBL fold metallo-hydrolase n=1 Tax=Streptomyces sp. NPDC020125 TaxID=3154593 RepID=UPI0033F832C5